jgi:hypothetical protein
LTVALNELPHARRNRRDRVRHETSGQAEEASRAQSRPGPRARAHEAVAAGPVDRVATLLPAFADLGVPGPLADVLAASGITAPFPIQPAALPDALAGRDILGRGRTASGKTLGFAIPLVAALADGYTSAGRPRGLVLVPTRDARCGRHRSLAVSTAGRCLQHGWVDDSVPVTVAGVTCWNPWDRFALRYCAGPLWRQRRAARTPRKPERHRRTCDAVAS